MERTYSSTSTASSTSSIGGAGAASSSPYIPPALARRHPASLLPKFQHDPALLELVRSPVTAEMISELPFSRDFFGARILT